MQRIMVLGCCGAGKSTFARKLHDITGLELIHLDQHYWQPNWKEPPQKDWELLVLALSNRQSWVIDGNYGGTMDIRIQRADTIIYLDYPTLKSFWRVILRIIKNWGKSRNDMPSHCPERFDLAFLHYVATFNLIRRKGILKKLEAVAHEKQVLVFTSDKQAADFLNEQAVMFMRTIKT